MVAISFTVFKEKIISGEKKQTIRPYSKKRWNSLLKNRKLQLYWKLRTKEAEFLKEVELKELFKIAFRTYFDDLGHECVTILKEENGTWRELDSGGQEDLALRDGFDGLWDLMEWFYKKYGEDMYKRDFMVIRW